MPTAISAPVLDTAAVKTIPESARTKCEVWTRVMGYYRPMSQFNIGKKQEARERVYFSESKTMMSANGGCGGGCDCGCGE